MKKSLLPLGWKGQSESNLNFGPIRHPDVLAPQNGLLPIAQGVSATFLDNKKIRYIVTLELTCLTTWYLFTTRHAVMAESLAESDPWVSSATWETLPTEPSRYADAERAMTMTTATNQTAKRRLVTVRHINEITGARGLRGCVQVRIGGWTVLSQKIAPLSRKKWAVGDLVVFFEIDSFLPNTCPFQDFFTTPEKVQRFRGKEGYRVRSRYHKGIFSQGLILPLNMFWDINSAYQDRIAKVGELAALEGLLAGSYQDVVGVVKWEDEVETTQDPIDIIGRPPVFIENPCWERAQNMEHEIFSPAKRDKVWQVTEKLDGKTMHVYKVSAGSKWMDCIRELSQGYPKSMRDDDGRGHLGVCSRSEDFMDSPEHLNLYWTTAKDSEITSKIWDIMCMFWFSFSGDLNPYEF